MKGATKPIRLLANTLEVVNALAERGPLTPAEIAEAVGIPRSSVYRLVEGLREIGLAENRGDGPVALSKRWLHLSGMARAGLSEWDGADRILADVAEATGQTAFLTVPRGDEAVCVDWAQAGGIGLLVLKPGRSLPLHAGAGGRVILALGNGDREAFLQRAPLPAFTAKTLTTRAQLEQDMALTREKGFVLSDEDVTPGIGATGVPIVGADGELRGCLSIGGLIAPIRGGLPEHLAVLKEAAKSLA